MKKNFVRLAVSAGFMIFLLIIGNRLGNMVFPFEETKRIEMKSGEIQPGVPLYNEFAKNYSPRETLSICRALDRVYDTSRVSPGDRYRVYNTTYGAVVKLVYKPSPLKNYVVERTTAGFISFEREPDVQQKLVAVRGEIQSSLYAGLAGSGITSANFIMNFAEIFQWQVDFLTEVRRGDEFGIVYEQYFVDGEPVEYGSIIAAEYNGKRASRTAYRYTEGNYSGYYDSEGGSLRKQFLRAPLEYTRISSHYNPSRMHPIHREVRPHLGIDYAAPTGTPVSSIGSGRVTYIGWKGGFGKTVRIRHSSTYSSQYGHLSRYARGLRVGINVSQGEVIGYVGMTGTATGPHLDFRFFRHGEPINYLNVDLPPAESISGENMDDFKETVREADRYFKYLQSDFFDDSPGLIREFKETRGYGVLSKKGI